MYKKSVRHVPLKHEITRFRNPLPSTPVCRLASSLLTLTKYKTISENVKHYQLLKCLQWRPALFSVQYVQFSQFRPVYGIIVLSENHWIILTLQAVSASSSLSFSLSLHHLHNLFFLQVYMVETRLCAPGPICWRPLEVSRHPPWSYSTYMFIICVVPILFTG